MSRKVLHLAADCRLLDFLGTAGGGVLIGSAGTESLETTTSSHLNGLSSVIAVQAGPSAGALAVLSSAKEVSCSWRSFSASLSVGLARLDEFDTSLDVERLIASLMTPIFELEARLRRRLFRLEDLRVKVGFRVRLFIDHR